MTTFAVTYHYADEPERLDAVRPEHRAFLGKLHESGELIASGPYPDTGGGQALLILQGEDDSDVLAALDGDPFRREGLIERREVHDWNVVIGSIGGA